MVCHGFPLSMFDIWKSVTPMYHPGECRWQRGACRFGDSHDQGHLTKVCRFRAVTSNSWRLRSSPWFCKGFALPNRGGLWWTSRLKKIRAGTKNSKTHSDESYGDYTFSLSIRQLVICAYSKCPRSSSNQNWFCLFFLFVLVVWIWNKLNQRHFTQALFDITLRNVGFSCRNRCEKLGWN